MNHRFAQRPNELVHSVFVFISGDQTVIFAETQNLFGKSFQWFTTLQEYLAPKKIESPGYPWFPRTVLKYAHPEQFVPAPIP